MGIKSRFKNHYAGGGESNLKVKSMGVVPPGNTAFRLSFLAVAAVAAAQDACLMHTYFDSSALAQDGPDSVLGAWATIAAWRTAWEQAGWRTRVLNESHAQQHPHYNILKLKLARLPTVNPKDYELACFLRYVAMAAVGCLAPQRLLIFGFNH